jgi:hypothetical protein
MGGDCIEALDRLEEGPISNEDFAKLLERSTERRRKLKRYELFEDRTDEPSIDNAAFAAMLANAAAEFQAARPTSVDVVVGIGVVPLTI